MMFTGVGSRRPSLLIADSRGGLTTFAEEPGADAVSEHPQTESGPPIIGGTG